MTTQEILQGVHDWTNGKIVYDISVAHPDGQGNPTKYATLAAALGTNGANIPQNLRKGGISVKFVQSSDNNYVQFRCKTQSFSADPEDWYFEGDDTLVESPEYLRAITDGAGHLLGWIRKEDGGIDWAVGVPKPVKDYVAAEIEKILNGSVSTDIDGINKIIAFLDDFSTSDTLAELLATKVDKEEGKSLIPTQYIQEVENPEYIHALIDNNDKITEATKKDGTKVIGGGLEVKGKVSSPEVSSDKILLKGIELSPASTVDVTEIIEDPENRIEIKTDSEKKIISYRDEDGFLHENAGIETNSLKLTDEGMTEFQQALKDAGFNPGGAGNYTDSSYMQIPLPKLAYVNITSPQGDAIWPTSKADRPDYNPGVNADLHYFMEFYDNAGNYFKKEIIFSAQGNSSMSFIKKNGAADFCNNNRWDDDDTFVMRFGDWVPQDSFHFKAFYTDFLRGSAEVAYQLADEVYKTRGICEDRPWKKALINFNKILSTAPANLSEDGADDMSLQIDNGARCMPDGFPAIFYLNGEFYGIYVWSIKKHRDNYHMNKKNYSEVHLDGNLSAANFWNGTIDWTAFEVRNPKTLYCMDGSKYDGDHPQELIDSSSEYYNPNNKDHKNTAKTKQYIINLSTRMAELNEPVVIETPRPEYPTAELGSFNGNYSADKTFNRWEWCHDNGHYYMSLHASNTEHPLTDAEYWLLIDEDIQTKREQIETYFDADNLIDYQLINMACGDTDGFGKNWQWITYDGIKWYVCQYDKDMALGNYFTGMFTTAPIRGWINSSSSLPVGIAIKYYQVEHVNRWNELVSAGLFTAEHIKTLVTNWVNTIGQENYSKEWKKWPESPCNRDSLIDFDNWVFTGSYLINSVPSSGIWDSSVNYLEEDEAWLNSFDGIYDNKFFLKFKAVQANTNKCPLTSMYSAYPKTMGYRDSAWRYYKYIEETIFNQNDFINNLL